LIGSHCWKDQKRVKSVKLLKDLEKSERKGRDISRGICFVEFVKHETARMFLENVKKDCSLLKRKNKTPICQFAIDDIRKLRIR